MSLHKNLKGLIYIGERLQDPAIPDFSVRLFALILRRSMAKGHTWAHLETLADDLGRPRKLVGVHIYKLEELGMITRSIRKQEGARTTFFLQPLPPEKWKIPVGQNDSRNGSRESKAPTPVGQNDSRVYTNIKKIKDEETIGSLSGCQLGFDQVGKAPQDCREFEYLQEPIPAEWIKDLALQELWFDWLEIKRKHKPKPSPAMMKTCRKKLAEYSPTIAIAKDNLENAIAGGWKTFYPPKDHQPGGGDQKVDIPDEFQ
tara:strand:+ start:2273 stop:3046 length:774 start_codon:yes stop_codon:yes gene_type:complete